MNIFHHPCGYASNSWQCSFGRSHHRPQLSYFHHLHVERQSVPIHSQNFVILSIVARSQRRRRNDTMSKILSNLKFREEGYKEDVFLPQPGLQRTNARIIRKGSRSRANLRDGAANAQDVFSVRRPGVQGFRRLSFEAEDEFENESARLRHHMERQAVRDWLKEYGLPTDEIEAREREEQEQDDRVHAQELEDQLKEEEARLATERTRLRDCAVCGDSKDPLDFPAKPPTASCQHRANTCKECMQSWMSSEVEMKGCDGITCPECSEKLQYSDVQASASAATFEAFDRLAMRNALCNLDEFAWCLKSGCGSGQLNIDNNNNFMECVSCGYKQCLEHKVPFHTGETCEQYDYRTSGQKARDDEKRTESMIDSLSKKCPGKCGWRIEKRDGCEHMTCRKCKHQFCWQCLASHAEIKRVGNTAHAPTCKFHSTNLDLAWPFNIH